MTERARRLIGSNAKHENPGSRSVRKSKFDIGRKAFNEFAAPGLMCIDRIADRMIEKQKLPVDTDRCAILRRANFLLDGFNGIQIFAGIQEHFAGPLRKNSIPIVTRERGKEKQNKKSRKPQLPGTFGGDDQI